jgi:phytanoyl-CoA hydroxylase
VIELLRGRVEQPLEGYVDCVVDGCVHGWAWNPGQPDEAVEIKVLVDGREAARGSARLFRPDLERAGKGDGRHGFEVLLPPATRSRGLSTARVVFAANGVELEGGVVSLKPSTDGATLQNQPVTGYRSRFGGLWTDLSNAEDIIEGKRLLGWITDEEAGLLNDWVRDGFVVLKGAVPARHIDALDDDVERVWAGTSPSRPFVEYWENAERTVRAAALEYRERNVKLLDLHAHFEAARRVAFAPAILRFLTLLFERPALAFQSLYFRWGSAQDIHQDTAFVKVSSPMELVASWVALEDVQPDSGELEYYVGSHRLADFLFDGHSKWMPLKSGEYEAFIQSLHARSQARGLKRETFRPAKGDALIWSADLAHGGRKDAVAGRTRKSLVTHYCPGSCQPLFERAGKGAGRQDVGADAAFTFERRG